jgi:hypothetical protein
MRRVFVSIASTLAVLSLVIAGAGAAPAAAQGTGVVPGQTPPPDLPCEITYDRTVAPLDVVVSDTVHVRVDVDGTCEGSAPGIDLFLVVDRTITMQQEGYLNATKEALKNFINRMDFTKSSGGLISFASASQVNKNLTTSRDDLIQAVNAIRLSQETDVRGLQDAFRTATQKLDGDGSPDNEKVIIILIAGQDVNQNLLNMPTVTQAARNAGVKVVFLMFPNAHFAHYVDAASDCTLTACQVWQGRGGVTVRKWAWGVDTPTIDGTLQTLADLLVAAVDVSSVRVNEAMDSGAAMVETSVVPPPTRFVGVPYRESWWEYTQMPPGGLHIDYDAVMVYADEEYAPTVASVLYLTFTDGTDVRIDLPNPKVMVRSVPTATATQASTNTPTPETPTATPSGTTPTATPTATLTDTRHYVYLPLVLNGAVIK